MVILIFSLAIAASATLAIYFRQKNELNRFAFFKPLTTILIIILSLIIYQQNETSYGWIITLGLIFSLVGDVLLLKKSLFIYGLGAFLIAHLLFIYAFATVLGFQSNLFILTPLLFIGLIYYRFLYPSLRSLTIPVALYLIVILAMDWQAISLALIQNSTVFYLIGLGAILFSFSDAILAYKKFKRDFKLAEVLILSTYWLAVYLFCISSISIL